MYVTSLFLSICIFMFFTLKKSSKIHFFSKGLTTDNAKMIQSAREFKLHAWPSKMHSERWARNQLREVWVIFLAILIQKFRCKPNERTNIALGLLSHAVSALMIFFITSQFANEIFAFLIAGIYFMSSWSFQVALYLGHVLLANMFFLIAIYFMIVFFKHDVLLALVGSSIAIALSFFSSSASRKYPYMWVATLLLLEVSIYNFNNVRIIQNLFVNPFPTVLLFILFLICLIIKTRITKFIFAFLKIISTTQPSPKYNISRQHERFVFVLFIALAEIIFLSFYLLISKDIRELSYLLSIVLGILSVQIYILMPNIVESVNRYRVFLDIGNWANHFQIYTSKSESIFGRELSVNQIGKISIWFITLQRYLSPVHFYAYLTSCVILFSLIFEKQTLDFLYEGLFVLFVSTVPIIVHKLSNGILVGKALYAQYTGYFYVFIFLIAKFSSEPKLFRIILIMLTLLCILAFMQLLFFLNEALKARSSVGGLISFLKKRNIKSIATYETPFNDSLVKLVEETNLFEIKYINSIKECNVNYMVIPNRSSKSVAMESTSLAALGLDFAADPDLKFLEDSKKLDSVTIYKFPTIGSSKKYIFESEVTGFRFTQLKQYSTVDFERTYGRVIDVLKAKALILKGSN